MGKLDNLKPVKTHEEAAALGKKGGIASGRARARRASLRELLEIALDQPYKSGLFDDERKGMTNGEALVYGLVNHACLGASTQAQLAIFKILGQVGPKNNAVDDADEFEQASVEGNA